MTATKIALTQAAIKNGWSVVANTHGRLSVRRGEDFIGINFNGGARITYAEAWRGEKAWKVFNAGYIANENVKDQVLAALATSVPGVSTLSEFVDVEQRKSPVDGSSLTLWRKNRQGEYVSAIELPLDAEDALLEILLARRNARLAEMRTT